MKVVIRVVITILWSSVLSNAQSVISNRVESMCGSQASQKVRKSNSHSTSVLQNRGLTAVSLVASGEVFIGGYNTEFKENKVLGYGLLWKLAQGTVQVNRLPFGRVDRMFWLNRYKGWITVYGDGTYETLDGGKNWTRWASSKEVYGSIFFLSENLGWYYARDEFLTRIKKGKVEKLGRFRNFPNVKKIQFTSNTSGWMLEAGASKFGLQRTKDGGTIWDEVHVDNNNVMGFQFFNDYQGVANTDKGVYATDDSGNTWRLLKENSPEKWYGKLYFIDRQIGWIAGNDFCFTDDGGLNWRCNRPKKELRKREIKELVFVDSMTGWLLTDNGLYLTSDSGVSWRRNDLFFNEDCF